MGDSRATVAGEEEGQRGEGPGGAWLSASCVEGRCPTPTWRGARGPGGCGIPEERTSEVMQKFNQPFLFSFILFL